MTTYALGAQGTDDAGRGPASEGGQAEATGKTVRAPTWKPGTNIGNSGARNQADVIFAPVVRDAADVLEQGGRLAASFLSYFSAAKAELVAGPGLGMAQDVVGGAGQYTVFQVDGVLPLDEWTIEIPILSVGADLTAHASGTIPLLAIQAYGINTQTLYVHRTGTTTLATRMHVNGVSGAQASLTLSVGDVPADTWQVVSVTYKASQLKPLRIMVGNNVRVSSGAGETSPGAEGVWTLPWTGFVTTGRGIGLGTDLQSAVASAVRVGMPTIRRAQMAYNASANVKTPTIAVDPDTTSGAMPDTGGMLWQYEGWTPVGHDSSSSVRAQLAAMHGAAGLKRARIEHILDKALITGTGAAPVYDWTPVWALMDELNDAGCTTFDFTLGYTPTPLIDGGDRYDPPSDDGQFAAMCLAFMQAAETRYGLDALGSWSLWNEPDLENFWSGTTEEFVALWRATHDALADAYPTVSAGATEPSSWATGADLTAIIDAAATDGRRLDHVRIHDYSGDLATMLQNVADVKAYVAAKASNGDFSNVDMPVAITEWNWSLQDLGQWESQSVAFSAYREPPSRSEKMAAYAFAFAVELLDTGAPFSSFTRGGITTAGSPNGVETHLGCFSIDDPPRPLPVWAAFQALWKLNGTTRIAAAVNGWPSLRALAGKTAGGVITLAYGTWKPQIPDERHPVSFEWSNLPESFTWRHWQLDRTNYRDGRLMLVAQGDETNLPIGTEIGVMGVGCIQITP